MKGSGRQQAVLPGNCFPDSPYEEQWGHRLLLSVYVWLDSNSSSLLRLETSVLMTPAARRASSCFSGLRWSRPETCESPNLAHCLALVLLHTLPQILVLLVTSRITSAELMLARTHKQSMEFHGDVVSHHHGLSMLLPQVSDEVRTPAGVHALAFLVLTPRVLHTHIPGMVVHVVLQHVSVKPHLTAVPLWFHYSQWHRLQRDSGYCPKH